jgi:phytoene synthase
MDAARRLYAEIGAEVARRGYDSVSMRAVVPATRKSRLLLAALGASFDPTRRVPAPHEAPPPLPAVRHLVDAVVAAPSPDVVGERGFADGVVWMLVLFERLERREHGPRRP